MDCANANYKKGSKGDGVKSIQTLLQQKGYYNGRIDGDYGDLTVEAVKKYQKANGLLQDGIVGPVTCKKLQGATVNTSGIYMSSPHWTSKGCNRLGQCTSYYCGVHALHQVLCKFGIEDIPESTLAGWAGTTRNGTSHQGIETALRMVNIRKGTNIKVKWVHFSDFGSTLKERFKKLGEIIEKANQDVIMHSMYRDQYGHYEVPRSININTLMILILNSLGSKCSATSYCGYQENRGCSTHARYMSKISQPSIAIFTK
jgi:hypothetical protein